MPVPNALALTTIADGGLITAAPHRGNNADIQAAVNAIIGFLDGETAGEALVYDGTDWVGSGGTQKIAVGGLVPGTNGQSLQTVAGVPAWADSSSGPVYRKNTEKDVVNTVTETDLLNGEITIAAGVMSTNRTVRASLLCDYLNNSGGARTLQLKIKFGSTTLWDETIGASVAIAASATRRVLPIQFWITNLGAANSQFTEGHVILGNVAAATTGLGDLSGVLGNDVDIYMAPIASNGNTALDTATSKLLEVTATHSTNNASLSCRLKSALVEVV